ncbi:MAG: hypothetical protein QOG63_454 [Thermoleophilaceae bacterium]|jgi:hypothetical protein|nr:hypothetical protein [Thermoleophilaceae bacterium]
MVYLVGALSLWAPLYMVAFLIVVGIGAGQGGELPIPFAVLAGFHMLTLLILAVLLVICIRDAYRTPRIPDDKRTFWAVVLFLGNVVSIPTYWWLYMRPPGATG